MGNGRGCWRVRRRGHDLSAVREAKKAGHLFVGEETYILLLYSTVIAATKERGRWGRTGTSQSRIRSFETDLFGGLLNVEPVAARHFKLQVESQAFRIAAANIFLQ
jgi:hypothetical protein